MHAWTEEHQAVRQALRRFVKERLAPLTDKMETGEVLPYPLMRELIETFGIAALVEPRFEKIRERLARGEDPDSAPREGKQGGFWDPTYGALLALEICRENPGFMLAVGASTGLAGGAIMGRGTDRQKLDYGRPILTGEKIGAWGMTEPGAGSDAFGSMRTTARPDGQGGYVLNGEKCFITNAPYCDVAVIYAKIDDGSGTPLRERPFQAFIVENGTPGFTRSAPLRKMGMHSSPTGSLFLSDVHVPAAQLLGGRPSDSARQQGKDVFASERTSMLPMCLGIIERCLEDSIAYAKQRETWGRPIGEYQLVQEKIARMFVAQTNVENLLFRDLHRVANKIPYTEADASVCKLYAARVATEVALEAVQIMGGNGYMQEYGVERLMRDAKLLQIGGGTDEIQISRIARDLLGR